jgi:hypothetical protein
MKSKICVECNAPFETNTSAITCSDECRSKRRVGIGAKMTVLRRILESEKIYPRDDRLMYSENFIQALQEWPCIWCGSEEKGTGINLDRIDPSKPHLSSNVAPVCSGFCNAIRSNILSFEEMILLRPALVQCRRRRGNTQRN